MSERPSQQKQILEKLDNLTESFNSFQLSITREITELKAKVDNQPKVDEQKFENIKNETVNYKTSNNQRFGQIEKQVKSLEDNQNWLVRTVIGEVIGILLMGVLLVYQFVPK